MPTETLFRTSPYVRVVRPDSEQPLVYHSLLGNARMVNRETVDLLQRFTDGVPMSTLASAAPREDLEELFRLSYVHEATHDDRSYILKLLAERYERLASGTYLEHLQLVLTNSCNFGCDYCFAYTFDEAVDTRNTVGEKVQPKRALPVLSGAGAALAPKKSPHMAAPANGRNPRGKMTFEVAQSAIDQAVATTLKNGKTQLSISLFGGEPTLNRDLIVALLRHYGNGEGTGVRITWDMTTNGTRIDSEMAALFAACGCIVSVSVDYICEETGGYRGSSVPPIAWEVVRGNILDLVAAGVRVKLTSVLSSSTWDRWNYNLIDFAAEAGIGMLDVIVSFQFSFFKEYEPTTIAQKLLEAYDYGQTRGVLLSGYWYQSFAMIIDETTRYQRADFKSCPAIGRMLSIEPNGSVFACKVTNRHMGDIAEWDDIFKSSTYSYYAMRAFSNSTYCHGCEVEGFCAGSCSGALEEKADIYTMDPGYCDYIRAVIGGLLERHLARSVDLEPALA
jgi:uncharacterized protein